MSDQDLINAFLAKNGATHVETGIAYGVDAEADKAKRAAERQRRYDADREVLHDSYMQRAHDAFFTGDREEGYRLLSRARSV